MSIRFHHNRFSISLNSSLLALGILLCFLLGGVEAFARPASHYAESSRLASGKWRKIKVEQTGFQFISNQTLAQMGFSDPSKVRVYGFGGRQIQESFSDDDPDDLPLLPSVTLSGGIGFFGHNHIRWEYSPRNSERPFQHTMQHYAEESWYFLSDSDPETYLWPDTSDHQPSSSATLTSFLQPLLHENDIVHPSTTGRTYLGEDFRSQSSRTFNFQLPEASASSDVLANVAFGAKISSGQSSLMFKANGKALTSTTSDLIPCVTNADQFMRLQQIPKRVPAPGNELRLDITFQSSGHVDLARLDYIEIVYSRALKLSEGQLYFSLSPEANTRAKLEGADSQTQVWDVTIPHRPIKVNTRIQGSTLEFTAPSGYHEFIAFSTAKQGFPLTKHEEVSNQNLHSMPLPDMLIIAPKEWKDYAGRLGTHHKYTDGLLCHTLTPEEIYNEFSSGTPDVSAFRNILKMWHDRGAAQYPDSTKLRYCLILSRPTYDNKGLMEYTSRLDVKPIPIWQSETGYSKNTSYSTDDYLGMLNDTQGIFSMGSEKISVGVGRLPVTTRAEAISAVEKIINYVNNPNYGAWRNKIMIIADDQDNGVHLNQAQSVYNRFSASPRGRNFQYERLYLDTYPMESGSTGAVYPQAKKRMLKLWNDGLLLIDYIGHASNMGWTHEDLLNWTDITSFSNKNLPFLYAATCEFARWDEDTRSGAETIWAYPEAGIIATICPSRTVYMSQNGLLSNSAADIMLQLDAEGKGPRLGDILRESKNNYSGGSDDNKLRYALLGDPAMRLPIPQYNVDLKGLVTTDMTQEGHPFPELKACGNVPLYGYICDENGDRIRTFNGTIDLDLYDAEAVVETNGNGATGVVTYYNDRKKKLFSGKAEVKNGVWSTSILMPPEIENNYTPARLTFYAVSDKGREAHGECSRLYVYGYDNRLSKDTVGPEITTFVLNRPDFQSGELVHRDPIVLAEFTDPSGINLSDSGIGHQMMLTLDGDTFFNDVNSFYTPDPSDVTAGSLLYHLPELEPGTHTLELKVWDNANNSSVKSIDFEVGVAKAPEIFTLTTDASPAIEDVNFLLTTDRSLSEVECLIEVFNLNGQRVWSHTYSGPTDLNAGLKINWNLRANNGNRVERGIYLYKATLTSDYGVSTKASAKMAVGRLQ